MQLAAPRQAWIFQANPKYYDIDRALRELPAIEWTVRGWSPDDMQVGDRVYTWRAGGPKGGVVAVGSIATPVTEKGPGPSEDSFYLDKEFFSKVELGVTVATERLVDPPLLRPMLMDDQIASSLAIIRAPRGTNYQISPEHDARLQEFMSGSSRARRYWWVNQGHDFTREREFGYITSPLRDRGGGEPAHWRILTELEVGDRILHYARTKLVAVGEVSGAVTSGPRPPEVGDTGWGDEGHFVPVSYRDLDTPIPLSDIPVEWRQNERGPFRSDGAVNQGYCYPLSDEFIHKLVERFPQLGTGSGKARKIAGSRQVGLPEIIKAVQSRGLRISEQVIRRYHLSLNSRRGFVILAGVSGTGKTWLAEGYAQAVDAEVCLVPVAPNWTTNEDLLGYLNPLDQEYHHTDFSSFLQAAADEFGLAETQGRSPRRYHLILDEMNLARVEYYFAKFLSAMELRARAEQATIELAPGMTIALTPNLYFTGTVNVDETTHGFADKVYDRAQLIELPISRDVLAAHLDGQSYRDVLPAIWDALHEVAPFAFRVLDEIGEYVHSAAGVDVAWEVAFDEQLLQKVLPKVKGTDLRLRSALKDFIDVAEDRFPLSAEKAGQMLAAFNEHGFTSYF